MSKRHQASRRRTYGRRQHELHQRPDVQAVGPFQEMPGAVDPRERVAATPTVEDEQPPFVFRFAD